MARNGREWFHRSPKSTVPAGNTPEWGILTQNEAFWDDSENTRFLKTYLKMEVERRSDGPNRVGGAPYIVYGARPIPTHMG